MFFVVIGVYFRTNLSIEVDMLESIRYTMWVSLNFLLYAPCWYDMCRALDILQGTTGPIFPDGPAGDHVISQLWHICPRCVIQTLLRSSRLYAFCWHNFITDGWLHLS